MLKLTEEINSFTEEYKFLSNFYPSKVKVDGIWYPTAEHAYQASKTLYPHLRKRIANLDSPAKAKKEGQKLKLRENWEENKISIMFWIVLFKFDENKDLKKKLLSTGNAILIEGNTWNDTFWGVCKGKGENNLGKILMEVRKILKDKGEYNEKT